MVTTMDSNYNGFIEVPKINPKTNSETKTFACRECGSIVVNRKTHIFWHRKIKQSDTFWAGVDDSLDYKDENDD